MAVLPGCWLISYRSMLDIMRRPAVLPQSYILRRATQSAHYFQGSLHLGGLTVSHPSSETSLLGWVRYGHISLSSSMVSSASKDPDLHFFASFLAAIVNFPLWRASARAQAGFKLEGNSHISKYYNAVVQPPFRGVMATMVGMTWARGIIFYNSDSGKQFMVERGFSNSVATAVPPMVTAIFVQFVNMPLVRGTITIQNPASEHSTVRAALWCIYKRKGINGLWHGTSAGIMKTVPKYVTAVAVRDIFEENVPKDIFGDTQVDDLYRAALKSITAGMAGAALTNPLDVIRNEMFKTDLSLGKTVKKLYDTEGLHFMSRGMGSNMTAVAIPLIVTIFMTDVLKGFRKKGLI